MTDHAIQGDVYAWTAVIVLPINSALNPIMYTLTAIWKQKVSRPNTNKYLETLGYEQIRRKVGLCHSTTGKLCQPNNKWVPFSSRGRRLRQQKERDGLRLLSNVPKIQWASNPTSLMAISIWEASTF